MSQSSNVKKTPLKVDATASDVLLTMSAPIAIYLGVAAKPAIGDASHVIGQPFKAPKGTGCYVSAVGDHAVVTAGPLGVAATPATLIEQGFTLKGGALTAATGDNVDFDTAPVGASGTTVYKWYWQQTPTSNRIFIDPTANNVPGGNPNPSAATSKLTNNGVTKASQGLYICEATDADGSYATARFSLTVTA